MDLSGQGKKKSMLSTLKKIEDLIQETEEMTGKGLLDSAYREPEEVGLPYVTTSEGIDAEIKALTFDRTKHLQNNMKEDMVPKFSRTMAFKNFRRGPADRNTVARGISLVSKPPLSSIRVDKHNVSGLPLPRVPQYMLEIDSKDPTKFKYREVARPFVTGQVKNLYEYNQGSYNRYAENKEEAQEAREGRAREQGVERPEPNVIGEKDEISAEEAAAQRAAAQDQEQSINEYRQKPGADFLEKTAKERKDRIDEEKKRNKLKLRDKMRFKDENDPRAAAEPGPNVIPMGGGGVARKRHVPY